VLKLEISYNRVIDILKGFGFLLEDFFFEDYNFCTVKIFEFPFILLLP
jgi:hypothetical protein